MSTIPHSNVPAPSSQLREDRREEEEEKKAGVVLRVLEQCGLEGLAADMVPVDIDEALLGEHVCRPSKGQATSHRELSIRETSNSLMVCRNVSHHAACPLKDMYM